VIRGDLKTVRRMLDKRGWGVARDHYGHTPLHKAVMANQEAIMRFLIEEMPALVESRDNVSAATVVLQGLPEIE
jgi:ankyrin repeat protein